MSVCQTERFTREEAEAKIGSRVESLIEFSGVPCGTTGRVVAADEAERGFDLAIEWDLPTRLFGTAQRPLKDWFARDEYEQFLRPLDEPGRSDTSRHSSGGKSQ